MAWSNKKYSNGEFYQLSAMEARQQTLQLQKLMKNLYPVSLR